MVTLQHKKGGLALLMATIWSIHLEILEYMSNIYINGRIKLSSVVCFIRAMLKLF
jgi:hypothetical protein